jgi:hypothetical protein
MSDNTKWADINKAGSGIAPKSTDTPEAADAQEAIDRANNASRLHEEANKLADHSRR